MARGLRPGEKGQVFGVVVWDVGVWEGETRIWEEAVELEGM